MVRSLSDSPFSTDSSYRAAAVESKLRQLVAKLEGIDTLARVHPFVKGFDKTFYALTDEDQGAIVVGTPSEELARRTEADVAETPSTPIYTTTYYIGLEIAKPKLGKNQLRVHIRVVLIVLQKKTRMEPPQKLVLVGWTSLYRQVNS